MPVPPRTIALVGSLSDAEVAKLFGRKSRIRDLACARGLGPYLPDLPPIEQDESLRCAVTDEDQTDTRCGRLPSKNRDATTGERIARATSSRNRKPKDV